MTTKNAQQKIWIAPMMARHSAAQMLKRIRPLYEKYRKLMRTHNVWYEEKSVIDSSDIVGCLWCGKMIDKADLKFVRDEAGNEYADECPHCHYDELICDAGGRVPFTAQELREISDDYADTMTDDEEWLLRHGLAGYVPADYGRIKDTMSLGDMAAFMDWLQTGTNIDKLRKNITDTFAGFDAGVIDAVQYVPLMCFSKSEPDEISPVYYVAIPDEMFAQFLEQKTDD